jgi:hypothetical protein
MAQITAHGRWFAALAVAAAAASWSVAAPAPGSTYAPARACAACHKAIHGYWAESEHSRSATSPVFLTALEAGLKAAPDADAFRRGCVWCHAPTALVTGDYALQAPLAREGVTCDFCHTVADVDLQKPGHPFDLQPGKVKRGPLEYAKPAGHETAYSLLHKSSPLLCAGCHEHVNGLGVHVLSTYGEWLAGPYPARGQTCQECHMPLVPGAATEGIEVTQRRINLHRLQGGSTPSRLSNGLELRITSAEISAASADVQVVVTNSGVGHAAPGGLSSKSLVLAVGVDTGTSELTHRLERVYRRELKDAEGHSLSGIVESFQKAASVGEDTRLKPKEARTERFTLPLPEGWKAIVARLEYRDATDPAAPPKTTLVAEERHERGR